MIHLEGPSRLECAGSSILTQGIMPMIHSLSLESVSIFSHCMNSKSGQLPSPRTRGCILGLILGLRAGLTCVELMLCLLRVVVESFESDFLGTGPLGEDAAAERGPGVKEPDD